MDSEFVVGVFVDAGSNAQESARCGCTAITADSHGALRSRLYFRKSLGLNSDLSTCEGEQIQPTPVPDRPDGGLAPGLHQENVGRLICACNRRNRGVIARAHVFSSHLDAHTENPRTGTKKRLLGSCDSFPNHSFIHRVPVTNRIQDKCHLVSTNIECTAAVYFTLD